MIPPITFDLGNDVTFTNDSVDEIVSVLGTECTFYFQPDGTADVTEFTKSDDNDRLIVLCANDNSFAAVVGAFILGGHLVLMCDFGDDGVYLFSPTYHTSATVVVDDPQVMRLFATEDQYSGELTSISINPISYYCIAIPKRVDHPKMNYL